ncbi:PD-(D/E)XK motif protein [Methylobacterium sp. J-078]|uniref:PD-(D/E)XK motif protein n=1 Tax=Methylobacterium sp. J-078 TaxID=2836657 RepID=UPI001FB9080A|nr:PD-(D/E)XK motif protein [Methylobacterium sp. J-078]MCJ2044616.1 PD-(D/E)XK motif protein [Methylobacterium sp. J-078]
MSEVRRAWDALIGEGRTEPGWHVRRVHSVSSCDIRAAISAPSGALALLFEVQSRSIPAGAALPACVGFQLTPETMVPGPSGQTRLCLSLRDARFRTVFETLAGDVAGAVASAPSESLGVKALLTRLRTWERFVQRFGPDHLSDEQQLGLFAELRFLTSCILPFIDTGAAVNGWRGPHGEPQDFRFRAAAIEVKATASRNPVSFRVSNLDQLDRNTLEILLVHFLAVDPGSPSGPTLPEVVADLRAALANADPVAASDLDLSLIEAGYLDQHEPAYADKRYAVRSVSWFVVEAGFPRLTRSTVPPGIGEVKYSVMLQSCAPYMIDEATALGMLRGRI